MFTLLTPKNHNLFLVSLVVLASIHPICMGLDTMVVGSLLNYDSYLSYFNLNPVTIGLNNAAIWMGQILSLLGFTQYMADNWGRKNTIFIGLCTLIVGIVLQSAAQNIAMFIVGRIIIGMSIGFTNISSIVLVSEICPAKIRGFIMGLAFSSFLTGALIASGITYATENIPGNWNWRVPSMIQVAPNIIGFINLIFVPESPRFLLSKDRDQEASEVLLILNKQNTRDAEESLIRIKTEIASESKAIPWTRLFKSSINIHRMAINASQAVITELGGSSIGSTYLAILLEQAGIASPTQRLQVNIVMSAWSLICAVTGASLLDVVGRKKQSLYALTAMVICFLILGPLIKNFGSGASSSAVYGTIAVMFIFSGCYSSTFTPLTTTYPSELYPYHLRATGTSVFSFINCSCGLVASFILPIGMSNIGWKFYIINACYDAIIIPIIYFVWVETKGVDIDFIDDLFWNHRFHKDKAPLLTSESVEESVEVESVEIQAKV